MNSGDKIKEPDISYAYRYLLDSVMTVRDPEDYNAVKEDLRGLIDRSIMLETKFKELLSTNIMTIAGRASDKSRYHQLIRELRKELGLSEE